MTLAITLLASSALVVGWADRICVVGTPSRECFRLQTCCGEPIGCDQSDTPIMYCLFYPRPFVQRWPAVVRVEERAVQPLCNLVSTFTISVLTTGRSGLHPLNDRHLAFIPDNLFKLGVLLLE